MLNYLRRRYAKARLAAYINGELSPSTRRFVAEQIESSPDVYQAYLAHRGIKRELERELPVFGQPEPDTLDALWASIESRMQQPELLSESAGTHQRPAGLSLRYGLALMCCVLMFLLPLTLDTGAVQAASMIQTPQPLHPAPQNIALVATPVLTEPLPVTIADEAASVTDPLHTVNPVQSADITPAILTPTPS